MDGDDRRTSQYAQSYHAHSGSRPPTSQPMGPPTTADRFAQPGTPVRSDSVRHSMTRSYLPGYSQYGYADQQYGSASIHDGSPMQGVELQYSPTAAYMQSARQSVGQAPAQQYAGYQQSPMLSSGAQQGMYDQIQPYQQQQSRQSAAIEVMSSQLGALPGHFDPQSALHMPATASPYAQQQQQQAQHYPTAPRQSLPSQQPPQTYASSSDYPPLQEPLTSSHTHSSHTQQQQQHHQLAQPQPGPSPHQQQQQQQPPQPSPAEAEALANGFRDFQNSLTTALQLIISSSSSNSNITSSSASSSAAATATANLQSASTSLLTATRWLTTHIQSLGLHHDTDSADQHTERLQMWTRLNLAWEALAEALRARVLMDVRGGSGGLPRGSQQQQQQSLTMTAEKVRALIEEVVKLADDLEGFGLVDYELGFAEELIVAGFLGVLDLVEDLEQEQEEEGGGGGGGGHGHGHRKDVSMSGMPVSAAAAAAGGMSRSGI